MIIASLATLGGVWLLVRAGRLRWAGVVLVLALAVHVFAYVSEVQRPIVTSLVLLPICASVGTLLGWWIRERYLLLVLVITAAVSDLFSTLSSAGFTHRVVEDAARGGGKLLTYLSVSVPLGDEILHVVGFADLMMLAVVIVALRNLGASWPLAFGVPFAGFTLALVAALILGAIPGLPFLALTTVAYVWLGAEAPAGRID